MQSQNHKISKIIDTVNGSITASDDPSSGKILNMVSTDLGNADALALSNATIANIWAQNQKIANDLNHAYQIQENSGHG